MRRTRDPRHLDAFEVLRQADPVDVTCLPGPDSREALALKEGVLATPRRRERPRRSHRRLLVSLVFVLSIASSAAAWVLLIMR
ncbi:MAG: hypothetical protein ACREA0_34150 [bacterium]